MLKRVWKFFKELFDRSWAVENGLCDFSGQGRDKYGK